MAIARTTSDLRAVLRRFARDRDGVSAVEFAIILPFMLTLYLGSVELGEGLSIKFKTTLAARTVTDLASQYVSIDGPNMQNILGASSKVLSPYSTASVIVTLSELTVNASGKGVVKWSCSLNGTPYTTSPAQKLTMPTNLRTSGITVLFGEVTYPYTPPIGYAITGTFNIYQNMYFYPRLSGTISLSSCS
ncbi:MAG TPA: TadE/TadG family type IV pilus assembly protein [Xanthobacteraceae bacterium]|nr:TadE/TadG family type IV pilus assembly protein [Xanthobacteraceae bacterium]